MLDEERTNAVVTDAARLSRIRLRDETFDQLADGGGDPGVVAELWAGESSRRLVLLRAFLDAAVADPASAGPLPSVQEAWSALERAERAAPGEVATILMHPHVGSWLAYTLRRHGGGTTSSAPGWVDFGQLHAIAIVACAAAGLPLRTSVPLREGRVMLPRLGMATFDDCRPWDTAEAATEGGKVWLRHGDVRIDVGPEAPGWWPLRSVSVGDEPRLTVWLDDLDPLRDLADPVPPARLSDVALASWTELLTDAWRILVERHRPVADAMAAGVSSLAPLPSGDGWDTRSASSGDAFGAIVCSLPPDPVTLAVSLSHEFAHIRLGGLMHLISLTEGPGSPCLYAPWRDDPRPAGGLLQGIYAFFGIAAFWRRQRAAHDLRGRLADFEYAYARAQAREALDVVRLEGGLTGAGGRFTDRLLHELDTWHADPLDDEVRKLAALVADGHRAGWRIRHCHPPAADVTALADAWRAGARGPVSIGPSEVWPGDEARRWSGARLGLARRRLAAVDRYLDVRDEPWAAGLGDADLALFDDDALGALKGFADRLRSDPESIDAWTGLGLALADAGESGVGLPGATMLLQRPEIVLALHRDLGGEPDPEELAAWAERTVDFRNFVR
ncbi:HEXXH motif domain-containing protein [Actinoplanes sp. NPDC051513]|uniref:HEXXH motif domain-containing protein n=1 Tax=Actinoplanes sp. NPDC051513 TaxID=3363908 RepID=UPI00379C9947